MRCNNISFSIALKVNTVARRNHFTWCSINLEAFVCLLFRYFIKAEIISRLSSSNYHHLLSKLSPMLEHSQRKKRRIWGKKSVDGKWNTQRFPLDRFALSLQTSGLNWHLPSMVNVKMCGSKMAEMRSGQLQKPLEIDDRL